MLVSALVLAVGLIVNGHAFLQNGPGRRGNQKDAAFSSSARPELGSWSNPPWLGSKCGLSNTIRTKEGDKDDECGIEAREKEFQHRISSLKKALSAVAVGGALTLGNVMPSFGVGDIQASEKSTISLFEQSTPSVVYINVYSERIDVLNMNVMDVPAGTGTGFVWNSDGDIVTNYHVIRGAKKAKVIVTPRDGSTPQTFSATVVGVDPDKDIAVLKLLSSSGGMKAKLSPIKIGTSKGLKVGQYTMAIGNPFGLDHTLTTGVVSGLGREVRSPTNRPISNVIQTDASINPGNSGGPLLDSSGALIGMNTAIYTISGSSAGIGFAIPVDTLSQVVSTILKDGFVSRPIIGVTYLESNQARLLGIDKGILVLQSPSSSPAGQAGIRGTSRAEDGSIVLGDIIIGIDDKKVDTESDLFKAVQEDRKVGDEVLVQVLRYKFPSREAMQSSLGAQNEGVTKGVTPEKLSFKVRLIQSLGRTEPSF